MILKKSLLTFFFLSFAISKASANSCIANFPKASVLESADKISDYKKFEDVEKQIVSEVFSLKDVGDVLVQTESCQHLVWTVIFLTDEEFDFKMTQKERFKKLSEKIAKIPANQESRFEEFKSRLLNLENFSQMDEGVGETSYFLWRRNEDLFADVLFRQKVISSGLLRTRVDYNISL